MELIANYHLVGSQNGKDVKLRELSYARSDKRKVGGFCGLGNIVAVF